MPKDTVNDTETIETPKVPIRSKARAWWDNNKTKLKWFGIGTLTGAAAVTVAAVLAAPEDDEYEGSDEETISLEIDVDAVES